VTLPVGRAGKVGRTGGSRYNPGIVPTVVYPSSRVQSEQTIAFARVVLAATALFAVWLDPPSPPEYASLAYSLHWVYVIYASAMALWMVAWEGGDLLPILTHAGDIIVFSIFQYLTLGPSSPFFVYFVFSMFCGAIRWGWRGTLVTGVLVLLFYVSMAVSMNLRSPSMGFEVNRFVVRLAYLVVATGMLVYLGLYEARLRLEIERLARWPAPIADTPDAAVGRILEYGARLMHAGCVLAIWEAGDEPAVHEALWTPDGITIRTHAPGALPVVTDEALARSTFMCGGTARSARGIILPDTTGRLVRRRGVPVHPGILERLSGAGMATSPFRTDLTTGRVFFSDFGTPPTEAVPLTEVVAREIASSLDQLHSAQQRQELAAREERIRVARDLHDGVLQGLTGVRLELRAIAKMQAESPDSLRQQLVSLERALATEQRELRLFISGLEPGSAQRIDRTSTLALRLDSLRERLALEWKTPVTLRVSSRVVPMPGPIEEAIPLMVHEAAVNALKHAHPSRVSVDVESADGQVRISVIDDGHGFPFKGSFDHQTLAALDLGPRSLLDRLTALGGQLSIESSDTGSRVHMVLSL
jgi:signal transduction histidine kinase